MKRIENRMPVLVLGIIAALLAGGWACSLFNSDDSDLSIKRFVASPNPITPGTSTLLRWEVVGAESVTIDNGIGAVVLEGSKEVQPAITTTYTLTARSTTSTATATVQVVVTGTSPTPAPWPTPTPTPTPTVSPTPTPTPTASPTVTPTPGACGLPVATTTNGCSVTVVKPTTLASGECIELTALSVSRACPAGFNTTRAVSFQITARTARTGIEWRRAATSSDLISPTGGSVANNASTSAAIEQTILGNNLVIEVFEGANVLLRFSVQNY